MSDPGAPHHIYQFGEFALDVERGSLSKSGVDIPLRPKAFDVLRFLIEHRGSLVSKDALLDAVWSPAVVTEDSVTQCLMEIRRAIDDHDQVLIRTMPRRGYVFDAGVTGPRNDKASEEWIVTSSRAPFTRLSVYLAAVVLLSVAGWWAIALRNHGAAPESVRIDGTEVASIAVLPFEDMSPGADQAYLGDGIAEEIIDRLVRFPRLRIIARTSSFALRERNADIAEIAARLHVTHVIEGSVRKTGDHIRITAQLIRASDSSHEWSHTYDEATGDALAIQDEIANSVAAAFRLELGSSIAPHAPRSINAKAYEHVLQARFFFNRRGNGDLDRALEQYRLALQEDPGYARAWAGLAGVYRVRLYESGGDQDGDLAAMKQAVELALSLAPRLPEVQLRAAHYYSAIGDPGEAWKHYEQAKALDPNAPMALALESTLAEQHGRYDDAAALWRRIVNQDPLSVVAIGNLAEHLVWAGRYEEAKAQLRRILALDPRRSDEISTRIAGVLLLQGKTEAALERIEHVPASADRDELLAMVGTAAGRDAEAQAAIRRLSAAATVGSAVRLAEINAYLGNPGAAFEWLSRACARAQSAANADAGSGRLDQAMASPFLRSLHDDPRWKDWRTEG